MKAAINTLQDDDLIRLLLFGNENYSNQVNYQIINRVRTQKCAVALLTLLSSYAINNTFQFTLFPYIQKYFGLSITSWPAGPQPRPHRPTPLHPPLTSQQHFSSVRCLASSSRAISENSRTFSVESAYYCFHN